MKRPRIIGATDEAINEAERVLNDSCQQIFDNGCFCITA